MQMAHLYPPGRVWWALRNEDLDPFHQTSIADGDGGSKSGGLVRLFEVLDVEKVFGQIVFAGNMLRCVCLPFVDVSTDMFIVVVRICRINTTRLYKSFNRLP
jgi:hypothetical protein